jgi:hypothetical protein
MGDWDDERGWRTSVLGRVDWSCWLAVVGLLFVTVISFVVQFSAMGIVAIVVAVLLVAFDSFVNRPGGIRGRRRMARDEEWSEVREAPSRGDARPPSMRQRNPAPPPSARQPVRQSPDYGRRAQPPRSNGQPMRQQQPQRPHHAQPGRPNQVPPTRANQPPQRQPYRPAQPQPPSQGREPDYRART